ncbi:hypothetical protein CEXT_550251 [Caerostris extrusa]|uniref:Uncharacterized protein n=1 Tax=Caerostris extrusa TaxID=172846 RepID=A0AAV4MGS8_CAEEX|nr:hypothetical protein CEXT_550251 [Caerostris extrusa]
MALKFIDVILTDAIEIYTEVVSLSKVILISFLDLIQITGPVLRIKLIAINEGIKAILHNSDSSDIWILTENHSLM